VWGSQLKLAKYAGELLLIITGGYPIKRPEKEKVKGERGKELAYKWKKSYSKQPAEHGAVRSGVGERKEKSNPHLQVEGKGDEEEGKGRKEKKGYALRFDKKREQGFACWETGIWKKKRGFRGRGGKGKNVMATQKRKGFWERKVYPSC